MTIKQIGFINVDHSAGVLVTDDVKVLKNPDDVVIDNTDRITIVVEYPLNKAAELKATGEGGHFTRARLFLEIQRAYKHVYDHAAEYGVWGHDIGDLFLEGAEYMPASHTLTLLTGS